MGAGFSRMNNVTVLQASQGLSSYAKDQKNDNDAINTVVVGHDHRYNSKQFAEITITAFLLKGFTVYYLANDEGADELVHTPLVPFTVDHLKADVGVMITASHNPADDNGYKVYWNNGCQIIPPHDDGIAEYIEKNLTPVEYGYNTEKVMKLGVAESRLKYVKKEMLNGYLSHLKENLIKDTDDIESLKFVYTPMHGVGLEAFTKVIELLGISSLEVVKEQAHPDPAFPTVKFPNPEEKGALKLAQEHADSIGVDLVVANDPDADRFTASVKIDDKWIQLTGNEIGFLFADYTFKTYTGPLDKLYFVNSTVSSQMIQSMAEKLGFGYTDTLTGFKWIGNKAIDLENEGYTVPFGFEEAIGFMFNGIHDKDGVSAALVFLKMAADWKSKNTNALEVLHEGFKKFGFFKEYNSYYIVPNTALTEVIFNEIRAEEVPYPSKIGDYSVSYWRDLTIGYQSDTNDHVPILPVDPKSQMITAKLSTDSKDEEFVRFTMRGSGTEPKLKVYIEAKASDETRAKFLAEDVWNVLRKKWFRPEEKGLEEAAH